MSRVSIKGNRFMRDGKQFFYLADTLWMAFSKLTLAEWREILAYRRMQGFSAVQISVLPVTHDNSSDPSDRHPFAVTENGYDYDRRSDAYFDHAQEMLEEVVRMDMVPVLHLVWVDYQSEEWEDPEYRGMNRERLENYLRYVVPRFEKYEPIYSVSGDTRLESERIVRFYQHAATVVRELAPEALITMHLNPEALVPEEIPLDFYSYQSGHGGTDQYNTYRIAERFYARSDGKPIVNTEPCYEGHCHGYRYERFGAADIRRAFWQSLLSGASAGVGYGAHGMWMMYRDNLPFSSVSFSGKPFDWKTALRFEGAWEGGFAKHLFESYALFGMKPAAYLSDMPEDVRCAETEDGTVVIYAPYACDLRTLLCAGAYDCRAFDMENRRLFVPEPMPGDKLGFLMPQCNADVLYILGKK